MTDLAPSNKRRTISTKDLILRAEAAHFTDYSDGYDSNCNICACSKKLRIPLVPHYVTEECNGIAIFNAKRCGIDGQKNCCYCCGCPHCNTRVMQYFEFKANNSTEQLQDLCIDISNDDLIPVVSTDFSRSLNSSEQNCDQQNFSSSTINYETLPSSNVPPVVINSEYQDTSDDFNRSIDRSDRISEQLNSSSTGINHETLISSNFQVPSVINSVINSEYEDNSYAFDSADIYDNSDLVDEEIRVVILFHFDYICHIF